MPAHEEHDPFQGHGHPKTSPSRRFLSPPLHPRERLFAEVVGPGRFELLPESETRFFSDTPEVTIAFFVKDGKATQLVLDLAGLDRVAKRVE